MAETSLLAPFWASGERRRWPRHLSPARAGVLSGGEQGRLAGGDPGQPTLPLRFKISTLGR